MKIMKKNNILNIGIIALMATFLITTSASAETAPQRNVKILRTATSTQGVVATSTKIANQVKVQAKVEKKQEKATDLIDKRIVELGVLAGRVQSLKMISDSDKALILNPIRAEISGLVALRGTIGSTTSTSTVKEKMESVRKSKNSNSLIQTQVNILATAGRVQVIATNLKSIANKLDVRFSSSSKASSTALTSFRLKITESYSLSSSSIAVVSVLRPDNGDKTIADSNKATLKSAREKIAAAQKDLNDAQSILRTIYEGFVKSN